MTPRPRVALALSTIGRPTLEELLQSVSAGTCLPTAVAVADHTPRGDLRIVGRYPFRVHVVASTGGASRGRNDAAAALARECEVLGFPNDDNTYLPDTLERVVDAFADERATASLGAIGGTLLETRGPRFELPPDGSALNHRTVWRAIEPAMFVRQQAFEDVGGFDDDLGTGASSPWQSGDGTDMLLRLMARGWCVHSRPGVIVNGRGERKDLDEDALVAKHRAYARGTGYVYRTHGYPWHDRIRILVAPFVKATTHDSSLRLSLRLSVARAAGRLEGLSGRELPLSRDLKWL